MTIERKILVGEGSGFAVGCLSCFEEDQIAKLMYETKTENMLSAHVAENWARTHDFAHQERHKVIIFEFQRPN